MTPDNQTNPLHYKDSYHYHGVTYQSIHQNKNCISADNKVRPLIHCIVLYIWLTPIKEKVTLIHFSPILDVLRGYRNETLG